MSFYIWLRTGVWRRFPRQQRLNAGQSVLSQLTRFSELRKLQAKANGSKTVGISLTLEGGYLGVTYKNGASGIDEQADGSKVLCSWRVVGTASLLENKEIESVCKQKKERLCGLGNAGSRKEKGKKKRGVSLFFKWGVNDWLSRVYYRKRERNG